MAGRVVSRVAASRSEGPARDGGPFARSTACSVALVHFTHDDIGESHMLDNALSFPVTVSDGVGRLQVRAAGAGTRYLDTPDLVEDWLLEALNADVDARGRDLVEADVRAGCLVAVFSGLAALYADWQP